MREDGVDKDAEELGRASVLSPNDQITTTDGVASIKHTASDGEDQPKNRLSMESVVPRERSDFLGQPLFVMYERMVGSTGNRAEVRSESHTARAWRKLVSIFSCNTSAEPTPQPALQLRIQPKARARPFHFFGNPFRKLTGWLLRTTFLKVIGTYLLIYMALILVFQLLLFVGVNFAYENSGLQCCTGFDFETRTIRNNFEILFELSWTTLSTVGYGTVSAPPEQSCSGVRYLLAVEAFIGILYSSICGAIFYSKISRLHTQAHVTFASAACLQYGAGVTDSPLHVVPNTGVQSDDMQQSFVHGSITNFPIIEMRCFNDLARLGGGEIIDASIKCVVSLLTQGESEEDSRLDNEDNDTDDNEYHGDLMQDTHKGVRLIGGRVARRAFRTVQVIPDTHPYLAIGVWYFRHTMDQKSPLLKLSVKKRIADLGGWPSDLNTPERIRDCFSDDVQEILVTFTGMSSLTADNVFLQHSYGLEDIYVGWKFAGMAYFAENKKKSNPYGVELDHSLIHDIVPAVGEESEPLGSRAGERVFG